MEQGLDEFELPAGFETPESGTLSFDGLITRVNDGEITVTNTQRASAVRAAIRIGNAAPRAGRVFEIAEDPSVEVSYLNAAEAMTTVTKPFSGDAAWEFPSASVSVLELTIDQTPAQS